MEGELAVAILAAGRSLRFGTEDKLASNLGGKMLGFHVADNLASIKCYRRMVVAPGNHTCAIGWTRLGYNLIINNDSAKGQSTSVSLAAAAANEAGASALLICLADMPFVTQRLVEQLIDGFHRRNGIDIVASTSGTAPMPPAIFPTSCYDELIALNGDRGARALLMNAQVVHVNARQLMDIDTVDDLRRANALIQ